MTTKFKVQTVNGNPEVIKVVNGIAREIILGDKKCISISTANDICKELNKKVLLH